MTRDNRAMTNRGWILLMALVLGGGVESGFGQGSLTPSGAPSAMMKTLDQLEPRIPIGTAPYVITQPGSYYVTTNLTAASGDAITLSSSDVTLDLGGFTVSGANMGVSFSSAYGNVVIRRGTVKGGFRAMRTGWGESCRFEQLTLSGGGDATVDLMGENTVMEDCTISTPGSVEDSILEVQGRNHIIRNCSIPGGSTYASLRLYRTEGCVVENCAISAVGATHGVALVSPPPYQSTGNVVRACTISGASGAGIFLMQTTGARIEDNTCSLSGTGIDATQSQGNWLINNVCTGNGTNLNVGLQNTLVAVDALADANVRQALTGTNLNLSVPGSYYLTDSMSIGNGFITGDDITLDLNGFTLTAEGTALHITGDNVTVRNGNIVASWGTGVSVVDAVDVTLEDLDISGPLDDGGVSIGSGGLDQVCRNVTLSRCKVTANTVAVSLGRTRDVVVEDCELQAVTALAVGTSRGTLVKGCTLRGNGSGFATLNVSQSMDVTVQGNRCYDAQWGISTVTSTNNLVMGNRCFDCDTSYALGSTDIYGTITTNREVSISPDLANFSF